MLKLISIQATSAMVELHETIPHSIAHSSALTNALSAVGIETASSFATALGVGSGCRIQREQKEERPVKRVASWWRFTSGSLRG
jgi:hypothetical protein